jgi:hypothetical protein
LCIFLHRCELTSDADKLNSKILPIANLKMAMPIRVHNMKSKEHCHCEFKSPLEHDVSMRFSSVPMILLIAKIFPVWKAFQDELNDSHIIKRRYFNGKKYTASNEIERNDSEWRTIGI